MRKRRLAVKLFLSYFWVALVAIVLAAWLGSDAIREFYLQHTEESLVVRGRILAPEVADLLAAAQPAERHGDGQPGPQPDYGRLNRFLQQLGTAVGTRLTVVLPDGQVVADSDEDWRTMESHADRPEIVAALETGRFGRQMRWSATLKQELMYVAVPVFAHGQPESRSPLAVVRTSIPTATIRQSLEWLRTRLVVGALLTIGMIALVSVWTSLRIHRLIQPMAEGAERFAQGHLRHRLAQTGLVEIDVLAESMNRMADQLNDRIQTILRQQNELESVLVSMQEGVLAVDNDRVVINLNQTGAEMLGTSLGEVHGRLIHEAIRKSDLLDFVEATLTRGEPIERDIRIRSHRDLWLSAHGARLHDAQGKQIGALVILHDVTRLRRLENVRRDFVANVSHELKTPITSIKGFVETLLDGAMKDPESLTRFLGIIARQASRLEAIIDDLLMLSCLERGAEDQTARLERGQVAGVVRAAAEMCEMKARDKQIEIAVECDPALEAPMNPALLEQALVNLIDNAVKYAPAGSRVDVLAEQDDGRIALRVRDQGCGIEPRHLPRLFERFYRADKARSRELGGTGLGLAIVKHIALVHQGSVDVQSTLGRGSTFSIFLPAGPREVAQGT